MKIDFEEFEKRGIEAHNGKYTYNKETYTGYKDKTEVTCPFHGKFWQMAYSHAQGHGCPNCKNGEPKPPKKVLTPEEKAAKKEKERQERTIAFRKKCIEVWGDLYNYSETEWIAKDKKLVVNCWTHGKFEILPANHLYNHQGCKECYLEGRRLDDAEVLRRFKKAHGDRYIYDHVKYRGLEYRVEIECRIHGKFEQYPKFHWSGCNCPECAKTETLEINAVKREERLEKEKAERLEKLDKKMEFAGIYEQRYYEFLRTRDRNRKKGDGGIYESHHIKPRSVFPELRLDKNNLILLTPREHFIAHFLLAKAFPNLVQILRAFIMMSDMKNGEINSREYENIKLKLLEEDRGGKRVVCIETGEIYGSAHKAAKATGIGANRIYACCNHAENCNTAGGFHWEYLGNENLPIRKDAYPTKRVRNTRTGEEFNSLKEAADKYERNPVHLCTHLKGRMKTFAGDIWEYAGDSTTQFKNV
jgi:hypothetical protein